MTAKTYLVSLSTNTEEPDKIISIMEILNRVMSGLAMEGFTCTVSVTSYENEEEEVEGT